MLRNEQGTVLIVAMVLLTILTVVGLAAIFNSSIELRQSSQYRTLLEAHYAAEGAIEAVKNDGFYATTTGTVGFPDINHPTVSARDLSLGEATAVGTIRYVTAGNPPPGYGFSADTAQASYFVIGVTGTSASGTQDTQEELSARILPK